MLSKFVLRALFVSALFPVAFAGNILPGGSFPWRGQTDQPPVIQPGGNDLNDGALGFNPDDVETFDMPEVKTNNFGDNFVIILKDGTQFTVNLDETYRVTQKRILPGARVETTKTLMTGKEIKRDTLNNTLTPLDGIVPVGDADYPIVEKTRFFDLTLANGEVFPIQDDRMYIVTRPDRKLGAKHPFVEKVVVSGKKLIRGTLNNTVEPPTDIQFAD